MATEARAREYCKVTLEARADNQALGMYRRLGYGSGISAGEPIQYLSLENRLAD